MHMHGTHQVRKLTMSLWVPSLIAAGLACGSSGAVEREADPAPPGAAGQAGATADTNAARPRDDGPSAEDVAALTDMLAMAGDQIQAACGAAFERCTATPGCDEILTCAAQNACTGADCYCLGEGCAQAGPCRSVIDSAPGARIPDAESSSLGPAPEAASAVGACLAGVGGGALPSPPSAPTLSRDAGALPELPDAG